MRNSIGALLAAFALTTTLGLSFVTAQAQEPVPTATPTVTQDVVAVPDQTPEVSTGDFISSAADSIKQIGVVTKAEGSTKIAVFMGVVLIIAQLLIQFMKTSIAFKVFKKVTAKGKLAIVSTLTVLTTIAPLLASGVSITAALVSGAVLSAIMVAGHQIYEAFIAKEPSTPTA